MTDFYEPDEPVADVQAAFDAGEKGLTGPPTTETCGVATVEITPDISRCLSGLRDLQTALAPFVITELKAKLAEAGVAVNRVRELHQPVEGVGYDCDEDDTPGSYGRIAQVCSSCGTSGKYGVRWPCPTLAALDQPTQEQK